MLIVGFLMFQIGLAATLQLDVFPNEFNVISHMTPAGILFFETIGGIIAIIGLISCFASITSDRRRGSKNTQQYLSQLNSSIAVLERKIDSTQTQLNSLSLSLREAKTSVSVMEAKAETLKKAGVCCKFCSAAIGEGIIFCPVCGKSQV